MNKAYEGLEVLDFTTTISGPHCTRLLADLGAEVIKVEAPEGDMMRMRPPLRGGASTAFGQLNAGKKSVAFDLKKPAVIEALRRIPYRRRRGDWNPMGHKETLQRVASFGEALRALKGGDEATLSRGETWAWVQIVRSRGNMAHGFKKDLLERSRVNHWTEFSKMLNKALAPAAMDAFMHGDWNWLLANLTEEARRQGEYAVRILQRRGVTDLATPPRIVVGTIHSVKGGEADAVYLLPELSRASVRDVQDNGQEAEDAVVRMAYVGMTRARRKLVLCEPSTKLYFDVA